MTGSEKRRARGHLLSLAPPDVWDPALIRLVDRRSGFDTTMRIVEPIDNQFAANQQSVHQIWEAVRRASTAEMARRGGAAVQSVGGVGPASPAPPGAPCSTEER